MATNLSGKNVVLGVTGSIAAYKAADLTSRLVKEGARVNVILSTSAAKLVGPLTFAGLTHRQVVTDLFEPTSEMGMDHISLAKRADLVIVAPCTANTVARIAHGEANDALTTTILATEAPVLIAPAGDAHMFENETVLANIKLLREQGHTVIGPMEGRLASGLVGGGRLEEPERLIQLARQVLGTTGDYAGRKVIVTAGGTQEAIDPVRVITNKSSGKMGYALAEAARDRGAAVTLVTTPTSLADPAGMEIVNALSTSDMREAVLPLCAEADMLAMPAAVSDFRPASVADRKIKKGDLPEFSLALEKNEDWLPLAVGPNLVKVAFAAETENLLDNAVEKLRSKGTQLIIANDVSDPDAVFGADTNTVTIIDDAGGQESLPTMGKFEVANRILDRAATYLAARS
jgi:phosphopantothenoylcysteine decarboxylase/phosphopantothenate--cysteine ligase